MSHESKESGLTRRHLLAGAAGVAGAWATPSILTLDRVAAAIGSCGPAPIQFDWSTIAPTTTMPASITALDGTVVSFAMTGSTGLLHPSFVGNVIATQRGALTDYMGIGLTGATNGAGVTLTMTFSTPVQACFMLTDIDRANGSWEDTVVVTASIGGSNVAINPGDLIPQGGSAINLPPNSLRGIASEPNASPLANVDFNAPSAVDTVAIQYFDVTNFTAVQVIGIHDLRWC